MSEITWDTEKNTEPLNKYSNGSKKKGWWKHMCECGAVHSWQTQRHTVLIQRSGCPYCSRVPKRLCYCRSLEYKYPEVAKEWDHEMNDLSPSEVFANSNSKFWWVCPASKCEHPHKWKATVCDRARGQGCPYCVHNPRLVCNCHSLATLCPNIAEEWHPTKNRALEQQGITASNLPTRSNRKVWWVCPKGHEFGAVVADRTRSDSRQIVCTKCTQSYGERKVQQVLDELCIDYVTEWHIKVGDTSMFIDFYLPSINRAIEFDGELHFRNTEFFGGQKKLDRTRALDNIKNAYCSGNGIRLLRIHWQDTDTMKSLIDDFSRFNVGDIFYSTNYPI